MEVKLTSHFQKLYFLQNLVQVLTRSLIATLKKLSKHLQEIVIPYVNEERKKIGDADQYALLIWDVFRGQRTEAVTSLL